MFLSRLPAGFVPVALTSLALLAATPARAVDPVVSTQGAAGHAMAPAWDGSFGLTADRAASIRVNLPVAKRKTVTARKRAAAPAPRNVVLTGRDKADKLRSLIAAAEAGRKGYDAVQHGARIRPAKAPTRMTIAEIEAWIRATPGQPHAIGRYQMVPATLRSLVGRAGLSADTVFDARTQDRLAAYLLEDAGYNAFMAGQLGRNAFMDNLARIWAGLPTRSGRSHYHGYAGNAATITRAEFHRHMSAIFD